MSEGLLNQIKVYKADIAAGETTSDIIDLLALGQLAAIVTPVGLTSTSVSFLGAAEVGDGFKTVYSEGADYTVDVAPDKYISIDPTVFHGVAFIKIVTDQAEAQAGTIKVIGRSF